MNKHNQTAAWRDSAPIPRHVAIIMDGNGRWAEQRGLPRSAGHRMGVEAVRRTVRAAMELGVHYLTIYSFSSENWSRPASEIDDLMGLMKRFIRRDLAELHQNGVRIGVIGEREQVDPELLALIDEAVALTSRQHGAQPGDRLQLRLARRNRQGRAAAGRARRWRARSSRRTSRPSALAAALDTHGVPDPDLLIRTSGELRLSNFLLWQSAYTEFVFLDAYWPDFGRELLEQAIDEFRGRDRRFGGLSQASFGLGCPHACQQSQALSRSRCRRGERRPRRRRSASRRPDASHLVGAGAGARLRSASRGGA